MDSHVESFEAAPRLKASHQASIYPANVPNSTGSTHEDLRTTSTTRAIKPKRVGVVYDAVMELHIREGHPEHPNRVRVLNDILQADGLLKQCQKLTSKLATDEELLMCHSKEHINRVGQLYVNHKNLKGKPAKREGDTYIISEDIYCNKDTNTAARSAAGCAVQAVAVVLSGEVSTSFAIVRPPGHHSESNELQGFCFYNNVAVAAHAALQHPGVERILILDWDIHHGNGTQQIFQHDKRVLFVSLHRRDGDFYPEKCGFADEVGKGEGVGYTVNVPWASAGMRDADFLAAFDLILDPIITQFDPQLVLISAGFDAADGDKLGKCHVTPAGYAAMTQKLMNHAGGKVVAVLEGGYNPKILGNCASAMLQVLLGGVPPPFAALESLKLHETTEQVLTSVDSIQRQYWSQLAAMPAFAARYAWYDTTLGLQRMTLSNIPSPDNRAQAATAGADPTAAATTAAVDTGFSGVVVTAGNAAGVVNQATADSRQTACKQEASSDAADGASQTEALSSPTAAAVLAETTTLSVAASRSGRSTSPQLLDAPVTAFVTVSVQSNTPGQKQHAISNTAVDTRDSPAYHTRGKSPALPETPHTPPAAASPESPASRTRSRCPALPEGLHTPKHQQ